MRILYFLAHPDGIGGAMKVLLTQAYIMRGRGYQVRVIIQDNEQGTHMKEYADLFKKMNFTEESMYYPIATCIEEIDILDSIAQVSAMGKIIDEFHPDIIHSVQLNISAELAARQRHIPHLMNIYPLRKEMFYFDWINVFPAYQSGDSKFYCDKWREGLDVVSGCIRVAYKQPATDLGIKKNENVMELVCIACFAAYKNQFEIVKFINRCVKNQIPVHISFVGEFSGDYAKKCEQYVFEQHLEEYVSFIGRVTDVERYLSKADCLIHASKVESYPGVLVEAMANHVPVIVNPVGGIPELLRDEENSFWMRDCSSGGIEEAFERFLSFRTNGQLHQIVENAYQTYMDFHSYESVGKQLEDYYQYILNQGPCGNDNMQIIKNAMEVFVETYASKICSEITRKHVYFLYHLKESVKTNNKKNCLIWGAGNFGRIALEWCDILNLKVMGFVDANKKGSYEGYAIYGIDTEYLTTADMVMVAVADFESRQKIMHHLEYMGKAQNRDYVLMLNDPCLSTD